MSNDVDAVCKIRRNLESKIGCFVAEGSNCKLEDGNTGVCKKIHDCPPRIQEVLEGKRSSDSAGRCGFDKNTEIVCCPFNITDKIGPNYRPAELGMTCFLPTSFFFFPSSFLPSSRRGKLRIIRLTAYRCALHTTGRPTVRITLSRRDISFRLGTISGQPIGRFYWHSAHLRTRSRLTTRSIFTRENRFFARLPPCDFRSRGIYLPPPPLPLCSEYGREIPSTESSFAPSPRLSLSRLYITAAVYKRNV